jgi:hypothetical protein
MSIAVEVFDSRRNQLAKVQLQLVLETIMFNGVISMANLLDLKIYLRGR